MMMMMAITDVQEGPSGPPRESPGFGHNTASDTKWEGEKEGK